MSKPIALIFGAGPNVGISTARKFLSNGYRVVQTSRSGVRDVETVEDHLVLACDVSKPESISKTFADIRAQWGHPAVVVYNAAAHEKAEPTDPYSNLSLSQFISGLNLNVVGVFQALKEAVTGFNELPNSIPKTFLFTGNLLNEQAAMPGFTILGTGKSAAAYLISDADVSYQAKGYRFFYVDERLADGRPVLGDIDGQAHAEFFLGLASRTLTSPWRATFVKGAGYTKFPLK